MKRNYSFTGFLKCLIKKYFSIWRKNDICHELNSTILTASATNENEVEEYLKNYQSTTRWQTL